MTLIRTPHGTDICYFFFSSRRRHTRCLSDWSSDVCSSDLSQIGSATRVAAGAYPAAAEPPERPKPPPRLIADFRPGVPDLASFPRSDWVWATREACGSMANLDLDYGDPRGSAVLRGVLAGYLRRVRAAAAEPGQMIVSTGFPQGVVLVLRALAQ